MEIKEAIRAAIQELIVPELNEIKRGQGELEVRLTGVEKRLDDMNAHLVDQSRRIDSVREELNQRIDETNKRIDETNKRLDRLYEVIVRRDEHNRLEARLASLERDVAELKRKVA